MNSITLNDLKNIVLEQCPEAFYNYYKLYRQTNGLNSNFIKGKNEERIDIDISDFHTVVNKTVDGKYVSLDITYSIYNDKFKAVDSVSGEEVVVKYSEYKIAELIIITLVYFVEKIFFSRNIIVALSKLDDIIGLKINTGKPAIDYKKMAVTLSESDYEGWQLQNFLSLIACIKSSEKKFSLIKQLNKIGMEEYSTSIYRLNCKQEYIYNTFKLSVSEKFKISDYMTPIYKGGKYFVRSVSNGKMSVTPLEGGTKANATELLNILTSLIEVVRG